MKAMKPKADNIVAFYLFLFLPYVVCNKEGLTLKTSHLPKVSLRWTIGTPEDDERIADEMISFMDKTVDPCDDFYDYACGQYIKDNTPPANGNMESLLSETTLRNQKILKELFYARVNGSVAPEFDRPKIDYLGVAGRELKYDMEWNLPIVIQSLKGMALFLGAKQNKLSMVDDLYKILTPMIEASSRGRRYQDKYNNMTRMTIKEFSQRSKMKLTALLGHVNGLLKSSGKTVDKDEIVAVYDIDTITVAQAILRKMDIRMRSLFLLSPIVWYSAEYLPGPFQWFRNTMNAARFSRPISSVYNFTKDQCYEKVKNNYEKVLWRIFADKMSTPESKEDATNLVEDMREAMVEKLKNVSWMDKKTSDKAIEKAIIMVANVGYPDEIVSDDSLEKYYQHMDPSPTQFIRNTYKILREESRREFSMFGKPNDNNEWVTDVFYTNAVNWFNSNRITIPTAFIQKRIYNPMIPRSYNYGVLGAIVGHEIAHSYDWTGRTFDSDGSMREWWTPATKTEYEKRAQCFRDQYNSQTYEGKSVNGDLTLGENIADNEGIEIAFTAYQNYVKANGKERKLHGVQLSNDQLFFLGFAQNYCTVYNKWFAHGQMYSEKHALRPIRVRTTLMNSPEFSAVYQCPVGSNMNPQRKCNIF